MQNLTREQQIQLAVQRIVSNPSIKFLIILDDDATGVQLMPSEPSFIWLQGVIATADKLVDEGVRARLRLALTDMNMQTAASEAFAMVTRDEVKN